MTTTDPGTGGAPDPSFFDIPGQIEKAIDDWFGSLIADALTPMLNLIGSTLLGTPDVTQMPGVERLWTQMALLANSLYILLVLAGAVIVTTHGTVQSRHSAKEIVPRLCVGMIAGNASIALLALMIHLSDALAQALLGGTINPSTAGQALGNLLGGAAGNGIFLILLDLGAQVMLIGILLTYIVRVAVTVVLAVAAPLALSLHALPSTEYLAKLWWKAITGVFLIQLGQSLVFVVALDVMLDPSADVNILGLPNNSAMVDCLVFLALCWILLKIPTWVSRSIFGGGSSMLGRLVKTVVAYKTLGMLGMKRGPGGLPIRRKTGTAPNRPRPQAGWGAAGGGGGPRRPGPGGGGSGGNGVTWTVTQIHPDPPAKPSRPGIGTSRPGLPPGAQAPAGRGPRLALEAGPSAAGDSPTGSDRSADGTGRSPRHQQMYLPIKATRVPRQKPATAENTPSPTPESSANPARARYVQRGLFPPPTRPTSSAQGPAATPAGTAPAAAGPPVARLTAPPKPAPASPPRPAPATPATGPRPARMTTPPAPPPRPNPTDMPARRPAAPPVPAPPPPVSARPVPTPKSAARPAPSQPRPRKAAP